MDWVFSSSLWARGIGKRFLDANPLVILMQTPGWFSGKSARNTILAGFVDLLVYRTMSHWDFFFPLYNFLFYSVWRFQTGWGVF
jgi:hypothetical protein